MIHILHQLHLPNSGLGRSSRDGDRCRSWRMRPHARHSGWLQYDQDQHGDHLQDQGQDHHPLNHEIKHFPGCLVRPCLGEGHCQGEVLLLVELRLSVGAYVLSFKYVDH